MVNGDIINIRNKEGGNAVKRTTGKVRFEEQEHGDGLHARPRYNEEGVSKNE